MRPMKQMTICRWPLDLAHKILIELAALRRENKQIKYLRPDAKSQVTLEYNDNNKPIRIDAIVISTQHDDFDTEGKMQAKIRKDMINILIPRIKTKYTKYASTFSTIRLNIILTRQENL